MQQQSSGSKKSKKEEFNHWTFSSQEIQHSRNLYALIGESYQLTPYRSKFQLDSIGSGKSRQSRDSDLLNRLAKESSKASSKSLNRNISDNLLGKNYSQNNSSNENSSNSVSDKSTGNNQLKKEYVNKIEAEKMPPKIHNCVCFVAGECLNYNCNCFLSPYPCAPECCPNCLTLKTNLPHKQTNMCSCKKTKCLKLYCECLSKGIYCGVMCRCQLCQNHQNNANRLVINGSNYSQKGCSCQKSHCLKKYCECYSKGLKCTNKCGCFDCHNMIKIQAKKQNQTIKMEEQIDNKMEPQLEFEQIDFFGTKFIRK